MTNRERFLAGHKLVGPLGNIFSCTKTADERNYYMLKHTLFENRYHCNIDKLKKKSFVVYNILFDKSIKRLIFFSDLKFVEPLTPSENVQ